MKESRAEADTPAAPIRLGTRPIPEPAFHPSAPTGIVLELYSHGQMIGPSGLCGVSAWVHHGTDALRV
jgi:hypothetical protein